MPTGITIAINDIILIVLPEMINDKITPIKPSGSVIKSMNG